MVKIRAYKIAEELRIDRNELSRKLPSASAEGAMAQSGARRIAARDRGRTAGVVEGRFEARSGTTLIRRRRRT